MSGQGAGSNRGAISATEVGGDLGKVTREQRPGGVAGSRADAGAGAPGRGQGKVWHRLDRQRGCRARCQVPSGKSGRGEVGPWGVLRGLAFTLIKMGAGIFRHRRDLVGDRG